MKKILPPHDQAIVALTAMDFFTTPNMARAGGRPECFSAWEFITHLMKHQPIQFDVKSHLHQVNLLLDRMARHGLLLDMGMSGQSAAPRRFLSSDIRTNWQSKGDLYICPVVGPEYLYDQMEPMICHLPGTSNTSGDSTGGTGLVIGPSHILTCAHVLNDMQLDDCIWVQGKECQVVGQPCHHKIDVGFIELDTELTVYDDLRFVDGTAGMKVFSQGFGKSTWLLGSDRGDGETLPPMSFHEGQITSKPLRQYSGCEYFLFSATTRPGNSGGPVFTEDGAIVGISAGVELVNEEAPRAPHFSAVPTSEILKAAEELGLREHIPFDEQA